MKNNFPSEVLLMETTKMDLYSICMPLKYQGITEIHNNILDNH